MKKTFTIGLLALVLSVPAFAESVSVDKQKFSNLNSYLSKFRTLRKKINAQPVGVCQFGIDTQLGYAERDLEKAVNYFNSTPDSTFCIDLPTTSRTCDSNDASYATYRVSMSAGYLLGPLPGSPICSGSPEIQSEISELIEIVRSMERSIYGY